jgi:hypothetical protein
MGTIFIKRRRSPHTKYIFGHLGFRWSFGIYLACPHSWRVVISTRKKIPTKYNKFS